MVSPHALGLVGLRNQITTYSDPFLQTMNSLKSVFSRISVLQHTTNACPVAGKEKRKKGLT